MISKLTEGTEMQEISAMTKNISVEEISRRTYQEASTQTIDFKSALKPRRIVDLLAKRPNSEKCRRKKYLQQASGIVNMGFNVTPSASPLLTRRYQHFQDEQRAQTPPRHSTKLIDDDTKRAANTHTNEDGGVLSPGQRRRPQTAPNSPDLFSGGHSRHHPRTFNHRGLRRSPPMTSLSGLVTQGSQQQEGQESGCFMVCGPVSITRASDQEKEEYIMPIFNMPRSQGSGAWKSRNSGHELMLFTSNIVIS